jgi:hypothetical protein
MKHGAAVDTTSITGSFGPAKALTADAAILNPYVPIDSALNKPAFRFWARAVGCSRPEEPNIRVAYTTDVHF